MRNGEVKYATVTSVAGNRVSLKFDGEQSASTLQYIATCTCSVGNRVICIYDGSTFITIGVVKQ